MNSSYAAIKQYEMTRMIKHSAGMQQIARSMIVVVFSFHTNCETII